MYRFTYSKDGSGDNNYIYCCLPFLSQTRPPNPALQVHLNRPIPRFVQTPLFWQGDTSHGNTKTEKSQFSIFITAKTYTFLVYYDLPKDIFTFLGTIFSLES